MAAQNTQVDPLLKTEVGGWFLVEKIGEGATARVYRAVKKGRTAALKILRLRGHNPEVLAEALARFKLEAMILHVVSSENIVAHLEDHVTADGHDEAMETFYLATELIEGESLEDYLARYQRLPPPVALEILRQLCFGLKALHALGVIHRDLKPTNIMLVRGLEMKPGWVKILDLGIAKAFDASHIVSPRITLDGTVMGTARYMSPEQARGQELTPASDLFALGGILFYMLRGKPVLADLEHADAVMREVVSRSCLATKEAGNVPDQVWEIERKLLTRDLNERPRSTEAVMGMIALTQLAIKASPAPRVGGNQAAAHTAPPQAETSKAQPVRPEQTARSHRMLSLVAILGACLVIVTIVGSLMAVRHRPEFPPIAAHSSTPLAPTPSPVPPPSPAPEPPPPPVEPAPTVAEPEPIPAPRRVRQRPTWRRHVRDLRNGDYQIPHRSRWHRISARDRHRLCQRFRRHHVEEDAFFHLFCNGY